MGPPHEGSIRRPIAPWANATSRSWQETDVLSGLCWFNISCLKPSPSVGYLAVCVRSLISQHAECLRTRFPHRHPPRALRTPPQLPSLPGRTRRHTGNPVSSGHQVRPRVVSYSSVTWSNDDHLGRRSLSSLHLKRSWKITTWKEKKYM